MIRYYDEHGNRLNIRTELDDALDNLLNTYYDKLSQMTAEQRQLLQVRAIRQAPALHAVR